MIRHGKKRNVAVAAVARELACFVWDMMTDNISIVSGGAGRSETAVSQELMHRYASHDSHPSLM
jgi:hypothetical protein